MKCLIPGINVKVLARAIHALSKVGDELYVEPLLEGISFRTVNGTRSAYASFTFDPSFFLHYSDGGSTVTGDEEDVDLVKCKISMKSCVAVFKSPNSIDKHVETCQLKLEPEDKKLVFQFHCRYGIVRNHYLPIIECETLQAIYTKDMAPNILISEPKLLVDALHNFQNNQEELTLALSPNKLILKNFIDFVTDPKKITRTELCLDSGEFVQYSVGIESSITFCLKEFRALLTFAESVAMPVAINFETAGRPVVFVISHPQRFEANFVLATLMQQGDSQQVLASQSSSAVSRKRAPAINGFAHKNQSLKRAKHTNIEKPSSSNSQNSLASSTVSRNNNPDPAKNVPKDRDNNADSLDNLDEVFEMEWDNVNDEDINLRTRAAEVSQREDINLRTCVPEVTQREIQITQNKQSDMQGTQTSKRLTQNPVETGIMDSGSRGLMDYSEQEVEEMSNLTTSSVGGISVVYKRCFQATFDPTNLPGFDEILAPDSDEEPD